MSQPTLKYQDGRPSDHLRLEADDQGIIFEHGNGPDDCENLGAREASVVFHDGIFHLFYDRAKGNVGWRACLATSSDLKTWKHYGPILELGNEGAPDSATATAPWFYYEHGLWHSFYLGCRQTTPKPDCVPSPPYLTCKAEATLLTGPWAKRYDVVPISPIPGTYYGETLGKRDEVATIPFGNDDAGQLLERMADDTARDGVEAVDFAAHHVHPEKAL
jgi:hypothetical protein